MASSDGQCLKRGFSLFHAAAYARLLFIVFCSAGCLVPPLLHAQEQLLPTLHFARVGIFGGGGEGYITARVVRDSLGFVWIGTSTGLQRYDGYDFRVYRNNPFDTSSIPSNQVYSLLVDHSGRLWVGTQDKGLCLYDALRDRFFQLYPRTRDSSQQQTPTVFDMKEDLSGNVWLAMEHPYDLVRVEVPAADESKDTDNFAKTLQFRSFPVPGTSGDGRLLDVCVRKDGKILATSQSGLIVLDPATGMATRPHLPGSIGRRLDTLVAGSGLLQTSDGTLWVGSATQGVFQINWESGKVVNYRHRNGDTLSISSDEIWDLAEDPEGDLWIGTYNGVELFSPTTGRRVPFRTYTSPPVGKVRIRLSFDRRGTLWVGTFPNLWKLTRQAQFFSEYSSTGGIPPTRDGSPWVDAYHAMKRAPDGHIWVTAEGKLLQLDIATYRIVKRFDIHLMTNWSAVTFGPGSSLLDGKGNLWWAGSDLGLYRVNLATGIVKNFRYQSIFGKTTTIHSIAQGTDDWMWVGALDQGVFKFNPDSGRFLATGIKYASTVMVAHDGKIWITANDGLYVVDPTAGTTNRFVHVPADPHSLSRGVPSSTYEDGSGRIWVGVGNVVNLWDPTTRSFIRYSNQAFRDQVGNPIGSDSKGRVWIAYHQYQGQHLSILDPSDGRFSNFGQKDGLCDGVTDMMNLDDGRILLTGFSGIVVIPSDSVSPDRAPPRLILTEMTINDSTSLSPAFLKGTGQLHLSYVQDVFEFKFAAMDFDSPDPVEYRYRLEGFEKDWVKPEGRRYVRYTSVPPGEYVFKVRASSAWGRWADQEIDTTIRIALPWWRTWWAYSGYAFLILGLLGAGYRIRLRQVRLQQEVEMEHFQAEHLAEVDRLKSRFFANISHEFRTPLTLVLGPVRKWRDKAQEEDLRNDMGMAERNANRLLRLINQLLDISKLEAGAMKLRASRTNVIPLVKGIAYSFESSADLRGIALNVSASEEDMEVYCDKDMIEKILTNLLSNAFTFTQGGGSVTVRITEIRDQMSEVGARSSVEISVSDTGIGIPAGQLGKIFDRFYQVDASQTRGQGGSGIGLALAKELVELHHGTIHVTSEIGKGTTFTVRLPLGRSHLMDDEIVELPANAESVALEVEGAVDHGVDEETLALADGGQSDHEKPVILVIEDNADVRAYIRGFLVPAYRVTEAPEGEACIDFALETLPDLIISDVMMPKKDGYEVCRILKLDERTSHIPIILLTAKAATENRIEGLEIGADDYLVKPFEPKELTARVKNLIDLRKKLRQRFGESSPLRPGEIAVSSIDDVFLRKAAAVVEQRMGDESFSVEDFGREVGMSRSQLHRKLTALTNQSPSDFIRYMRLHRAMALLRGNTGTVAEIAYSVGYGDPSHFSKRFHEVFGIPPGEVRKGPRKAPPRQQQK